MPAIEFTQKPIGETTCGDCGWEHATVRPNKRGMMWYYCDSCSSQHQTRTKKGSDALLEHMRPLTPEPTPTPQEQPMPTKKAKPKAKPNEQTPPRRTGGKFAKAPAEETQRATPASSGDLWNNDFLGIGPRADK